MNKLLSFLVIFLLTISFNGYSTHIQSAEINAKHISGNQYLVSLRVLTDCAAISAPPTMNLAFENGSNSFNRTFSQTNSSTVIGMNYSCACWSNSSTCNGGNLPGNNYIIYSDTVTLPTSSNWKASYSTCCRYQANNVSNGQSLGIYVETIIHQSAYPTNSTPFFPLTGRLAISQMDTFNMDMSVIDYDNDSIVYSFIDIMINNNTPAIYVTGYSGTNPITGLTLTSNTGELLYSGGAVSGSYYLAIKAMEYDRVTGNLKSEVIRDFGITILPTIMGHKFISTAPISNGFSNNSSGSISGNTASLCGSSTNTVDLSFTSTKGNVNLWSDISWKYPGVSYTVSLGLTSTMSISIPSGMNFSELEFYVQSSADSSFFTNHSFDTFTINSSGFSTSGDRTICFGDTVHMSSSSSDPNPQYSWAFISGTPIDTNTSSPGYSFSCINCPNPVITPTVTSTYVANSIPNTCGQPDTITITVIQPIVLNSPMYDTICPGDSALITVSGGVTSNLVWEENNTILNATNNTLWISPSISSYYLVHNVNYMCADSVYFNITVPQPVVASPDVILCLADSVQISATPGTSFSWTPTTHLSCSTCASPTASPTQATMYYVNADNHGCLSEDSVFVDVTYERYISGLANQSSGAALPMTKVLLISYDAINTTVSAVDSTVTDASGNFNFVIYDNEFYVKVLPDSTYYPNEIPTYYGDEALFLNSSAIYTAACDTSDILIQTISNPNPGGSGFISGNIFQGAGKMDAAGDPAVGVKVILVNDQGEEIAYSETNLAGQFFFSDLNLGAYQLFMDELDAQNQLAPSILVDEYTEFYVFNFELKNGVLTQTSITSVNELNLEQLVLYPNPAVNQIEIQGITQAFNFTIVGVDGKIYQTGSIIGNTIIDITVLPKGVYFLKAINDTNEFVKPFIKK